MADDQVQRYRPDEWRMLVPKLDGDWVRHADYAKLETELRDTKRALEMAAAYTDAGTFFFMQEAREERLGKR